MTLRRLPMCAAQINAQYKDYSLLDIGCRTMALKPLLENCRAYYGTDIVPAEGVFQCDLEEGLKDIPDKSYDIVVALDVLEHLDKAHFVLKDMLRVARQGVFVSLPNMYYIRFRLNYLRGRLSGKYDFPVEAILDRHRWVMSYSEACAFVSKAGAGHDTSHQQILPERGRTKLVMEPLEKALARKWPDLFTYGSLSHIDLRKPA